MLMESFTAMASPQALPADSFKHVRYSLGMVLGVDDFVQEFAYLSGRDQWLARDLLGYGTVSGLRVEIEADSKGPRLVVTPGVALSPVGQLIRVNAAQCANINDWIAAHKTDLLNIHHQPISSPLASPLASPLNSALGSSTTLYLTLSYRDCQTDNVPIPGEPCRSEADAMAASRLKDDFKLELRLTPPVQREEDALRDFVLWLSQVQYAEASSPIAPVIDFEQAIRDAAHEFASPLSSPINSPLDFMYGSPPSSLVIRAADAPEFLRAAFRLWVTELRPLWSNSPNGAGTPPVETGLLLAEVVLPPLTDDWKIPGGSTITIEEERRPYLLSLRMVQEWLLQGRGGTSGGGSGSVGPQGPAGVQGPKGDIGPAGAQGEIGPKGDIGPAGPNGPQGAEGPAGPQGLQGGVGPAGAQGLQGVSGPAGAQGPAGDAGPQGAVGPKGDPGATGPSGPAGAQGPQGVKGDAGPAGEQGLAGATGPAGAKGDVGPAGLQGPIGLQGTQGIQGPVGMAGPSNMVAAGQFDPNLKPLFSFNKITASPIPNINGGILLQFSDYKFNGNYVVKGTAVTDTKTRIPHVFEVISFDDPNIEQFRKEGIVVRVLMANSETRTAGFMVEISQF